MIFRLITEEEKLDYNTHQGDVLTIKNEKVLGCNQLCFLKEK